MRVLDFIVDNKEWLFSGGGIVVISLICKAFHRADKNGHKVIIKQVNKANDSTQIGIQVTIDKDNYKKTNNDRMDSDANV